MSHLERVIVLVDMDCFYCQVEEKHDPTLRGKPIAVVQYNEWRGGGIIAVNYIARDRGVTRFARGEEAKEICPDIELCRVPNVRGKADLTKYRDAGKDVIMVLQKFTNLVQRASVDEAFLDITQPVLSRMSTCHDAVTANDIANTHIVGYVKDDFIKSVYEDEINSVANLKLLIGAKIVEEIRKAVYDELGFRCSAGIAHNKILAKLVCGLHKPNQQTIIPHESVSEMYKTLPIRKIRNLGGKFGESLSKDLNITVMSELEQFSERFLQQKYDERNGSWLYKIARGIDTEPVTLRLCPKSIGCCKRFLGVNAIKKPATLRHWFQELAHEVSERLVKDMDEYARKATLMVISYSLNINRKNIPTSKSKLLTSYDAEKIANDAYEVVARNNTVLNDEFKYAICFLGISAGKFEDGSCKSGKIATYFKVKSSECAANDKVEAKNQVNVIENASNDEKIHETVNCVANTERIESKTEEIATTSVVNVDNNVEKPQKPTTFARKPSLLSVLEAIKEKRQKLLQEKQNQVNLQQSENITTQMDEIIDSDEDLFAEKPESNVPIPETESEHNQPVDTFKCELCEREIKISATDSHNEYHFRLLTDTPERVNGHTSGKADIKNKKPTKTEKKNSKTTKSTKSSVKKEDISVFFKNLSQSNEATCSTAVVSAPDYQICAECGKNVALRDFLEHLDFHEAKRIQTELNSAHNQTTSIPNTASRTNKRSAKPVDVGNSSKKVKVLTQFFKPL